MGDSLGECSSISSDHFIFFFIEGGGGGGSEYLDVMSQKLFLVLIYMSFEYIKYVKKSYQVILFNYYVSKLYEQ